MSWSCGSDTCPTHAAPEQTCATGRWHCGRAWPGCPGHSARADQCTGGTSWRCGALDCPGHAAHTDLCASGIWYCGRIQPCCSGHVSRRHQCDPTLAGAAADTDARFSTHVRPGATSCPCGRLDSVRIIELVEVVDHGGTDRRQPVTGRDQYINLDARVEPGAVHPEYGRTIRLQARLAWTSGATRSLAGQHVYWRGVPSAANKTGLDVLDMAALGGAVVPLRTSSTTDAAGWTPVVPFQLSRYGGDRFSVFATESAAHTGGLQAGPFVVWKKFWYQVTEMEDGAGSTFALPRSVTSAFEAGYRSTFVRFEEQLPRTRAAHVANLKDDAARRAVGTPHFRVDSKVPFKAQIVTIDWGERGPVNETLSDTTTTPRWSSPSGIILWKEGTAPHPWKVSARCRPARPPAWTCRRMRPVCAGPHSDPGHRCSHTAGQTWRCGADACPTHQSPDDRCATGVFRCNALRPACPGHAGPADRCTAATLWTCRSARCGGHAASSGVCDVARAWHDIPDAAITTAAAGGGQGRGYKLITVDLSSGPVIPSAAGPVELELAIKKAPGDAFGWGGGSSHLYLCTGFLRDWVGRTADWDPIQASDAVHEIGHALGLLNMRPAASTAHTAWEDAAHPQHCAQPPSACAMWFQSSPTRLTSFHMSGGTGCADYLRRQDFSRSAMSHW